MAAKNPRRSKVQQAKKGDLLKKCYTYLNDNFAKFNTANKIKVALEIVKKDFINKHEHDVGENTLAAIFGAIDEDK